MTAKAGTNGLRVLIVEDEPLVSMFIEDSLADIGCVTAGTASNLADAMAKASAVECDVVMLDVNLNGKQTFELADSLHERRMPFIFSTGYGNAGVPEHLQHVPVLQKPFEERELTDVLLRTVEARGKPDSAK